MNYLGSLMHDCETVIVLNSFPGSGAEYVVEHLAKAVAVRGYAAEYFHCSLDPKRIEHILVPEISLGIVTSRDPHHYSEKASVVEDLNGLIKHKRLALYKTDMDRAHKDYRYAINTGVGFILRAKTLHNDLETFYVPNMDWSEVNSLREKTLKRIIKYIES